MYICLNQNNKQQTQNNKPKKQQTKKTTNQKNNKPKKQQTKKTTNKKTTNQKTKNKKTKNNKQKTTNQKQKNKKQQTKNNKPKTTNKKQQTKNNKPKTQPMINVTKTFFPPIEDYNKQIDHIWKNEWLTNRGELVLELENKLKKHLEVTNIIAMNNGTIPIQIALKILGNKGEIITTPFSYVATTASIKWEGCTPVFVDIHTEYLTIDETKIEAAITPKTTAILAVHVFGNPCNVEVIEKIAKKHNLYVIYDAAHSFGTTYKDKSVFDYGDVSTCSFHATKLFHTGEGGALFCKDENLQKKKNVLQP